MTPTGTAVLHIVGDRVMDDLEYSAYLWRLADDVERRGMPTIAVVMRVDANRLAGRLGPEWRAP